MESSRKVKIVCRLCGESKPSGRIKCTINDPTLNIEQKLIDCCRWRLFEDYTNLPEHICNSCFKSLEASWTFAENVAHTQRKLLTHFDDIKVEPNLFESEINSPTKIENRLADDIADVKNIEILYEPIDFGGDDNYDFSQDFTDIDDTAFAEIDILPSEKIETRKTTQDKCKRTETIDDVSSFAQKSSMTPGNFDLLASLTEFDRNADGTCKMEKILKMNLEDWSKITYPCWVCDLSMTDSKELKEHISSTHPCSDQRIVCAFCPGKVTFNRKTTLYDHLRRHHLPHLKYCCVKCNVFYWDLELLKKHVQFHPMPRQPVFYLCEMCGVEFDSASKLRHHSRLHLPANQIRTFECYMCKVSFKCKKSLVHHMPQHSTYEKIQYECKECLLKFSRPYALRRHMLIHSGDFPHACEYCGKPFRTKANLKVHVRIHTGERPYGCKLCDYRSIDGPNLRKHMKQRHSSSIPAPPVQTYPVNQYIQYSTKTEPDVPFPTKSHQPHLDHNFGQQFILEKQHLS